MSGNSSLPWEIMPMADCCLCEEFSGVTLRAPSQAIRWVGQCPLTESHILPHLLCATATASPCRPCLWVSTAAKASCLFLVAMLEGADRSRVLLLWVTHFSTLPNLRKKNPKTLGISCHKNYCPYFFNGREPTDCFVTIQ